MQMRQTLTRLIEKVLEGKNISPECPYINQCQQYDCTKQLYECNEHHYHTPIGPTQIQDIQRLKQTEEQYNGVSTRSRQIL